MTRRRIINEPDVIEVLKRRGFDVIQPDSLTVAQQVRVFSGANVVVGPHGAGMVNTVFCAPGTRVVEMFSPRALVPCYWLIAVNNGLEYRMLTGEHIPVSDDAPDAVGAHINVNIGKLELVLDALGI